MSHGVDLAIPCRYMPEIHMYIYIYTHTHTLVSFLNKAMIALQYDTHHTLLNRYLIRQVLGGPLYPVAVGDAARSSSHIFSCSLSTWGFPGCTKKACKARKKNHQESRVCMLLPKLHPDPDAHSMGPGTLETFSELGRFSCQVAIFCISTSRTLFASGEMPSALPSVAASILEYKCLHIGAYLNRHASMHQSMYRRTSHVTVDGRCPKSGGFLFLSPVPTRPLLLLPWTLLLPPPRIQ